MADTEITLKVSTEADTEELDDLKQMLDELANNTTIEVESNLDDVITDTEQLQTEFEEANATVDELTEELANIELGISDADFDEVNTALQEASDHAEELADALNNLDDTNLVGIGDDADAVAESLGGVTDGVNEINDSMGLVEATMLGDMANQVGALGDQAENMAQDMQGASISIGQLATNAGIAEPKMVSLINYISNETFPQEEAMAYVNVLNQMGVSADKLGDSATNMDKINDATHMGYGNVMLLTQGLQALGISADNLPESFNAIAYAQANVEGGAQTLQQVLKTQAGTLNEYGMDVDSTVVALNALESQTGLTGRKLASEFGTRLKDCNGDLGELEKSLGLNAGALKNASNETGKYAGKLQELADEEMEHKTFLDRINAGWEDFQLALSPILSPLAEVVGLIGGIGQFALSVNSILTLAETFGLLETATISETIAQWGLNTAMLANPITWLVLAIIVLIGVLVWAYFNCEDFRNAVNGLGQAFMEIVGMIYGMVVGALQWLKDEFQRFTDQLNINTNDWSQAVLGFLLFVAELPQRLWNILVDALARALGFKGSFSDTMRQSAVNAVNNFASSIGNLSSALWNELNDMIQDAQNFVGQIGQILWNAGQNAVNNFLNGLQRRSPGKMQRELHAELTEMVTIVPAISNNLSGNIRKMSENLVNSFNPNLLSSFENFIDDFTIDTKKLNKAFNDNFNPKIDINNIETGNAEILGIIEENNNNNNPPIYNLTFEGCTFDKDERVQEIKDVINKELKWNNKTAGRTV